MSAAGPWWASDRHVDDELDPVAAHRAARRAMAALDPRVVDHLGQAASHLLAAARAFLATGPGTDQTPDTAEPGPGGADSDGGAS